MRLFKPTEPRLSPAAMAARDFLTRVGEARAYAYATSAPKFCLVDGIVYSLPTFRPLALWTEGGDILLTHSWDKSDYKWQFTKAIRYCLAVWFGSHYRCGDSALQIGGNAPPLSTAPRVWELPPVILSEILGYYAAPAHAFPAALLKSACIEPASEWPWPRGVRTIRLTHPCLPGRQLYLVARPRQLGHWRQLELFEDDYARCPWWMWDGYYPIGVLTDAERDLLAKDELFSGGLAPALPPQARRWAKEFGTNGRLGGLTSFATLLFLLPTTKPLRCPEFHKEEAERYLPLCATTWRLTPTGPVVTGKLTLSPHWWAAGGPPSTHKFCKGQWYYIITPMGDWWGRKGLLLKEGRWVGAHFATLKRGR